MTKQERLDKMVRQVYLGELRVYLEAGRLTSHGPALQNWTDASTPVMELSTRPRQAARGEESDRI